MEKHCSMSSHTDPFRDTCSAALCLRATAAIREEGIVRWSCWQWPSLSVLLLELLLLVALPTCAFFLLSLCAHTPNLSSSLFKKKLAESGTLAFHWIRPCSTISLVPGLLIALCRAIGSSTSVSEIRHSLWLNPLPNSDTDLTFSR